MNNTLHLSFGFCFGDLYSLSGMNKLDQIFLQYLMEHDNSLYHDLMLARSVLLKNIEESKLIIALAPILEDFITELFYIQDEVMKLSNTHHNLSPLYWCKRQFVQRKVVKSQQEFDISLIDQARKYLLDCGVDPSNELEFSKFVQNATQLADESKLHFAKVYGAWALNTEAGRTAHRGGILFKVPEKIVFSNLIRIDKSEGGNYQYRDHSLEERHGFDHHDNTLNLRDALDSANYCIFCHNQEKDSCSHGIIDKKSSEIIQNQLGVALVGCPLEEKISEMNMLKSHGSIIGSLAIAMIDNPLLAATGHRICNDCMKSCIYQKQEPVNVPLIETQVINDVLSLPYGFEVYSLLSRWNPLNFRQYIPKALNNYKILVAGLGPAGFTLSHYLLNEGFTVVAIDGLKIEPISPEISGIRMDGSRTDFIPIKNIQDLYSKLSERVPQGFGGVTEYGITSRWNKNYLMVIRLLLERRENFRMYGGVRFGGTITYDSAFQLGFNHIALALGAGKPHIPSIPNILAKGVRTASDFLMALQLMGAYREGSIANLQMRFPIVVIGGGLTAIDAATESLAYYQVQIEKFLKHYEQLGEAIFDNLDEQERQVALEYINHAQAIRDKLFDEKVSFLRSLGGVKVVYRKTLQESPSYRLNHEEVERALKQGIEFIENIIPVEILVDEKGECIGLRHERGVINAKSIIIATGTEANTVLAREDSAHFTVDNKYFTAMDEEFNIVSPEKTAKPSRPYVLSSIADHNKTVSFFGDLHPSYVGNVVKAMASAKQGYPVVSRVTIKHGLYNPVTTEAFFRTLDHYLLATVKKVQEIAPKIIEIVFHAPAAAKEFKPGQFYRLQNYESNAPQLSGVRLAMEGVALTGAWVDKEQGLVSTIVLEMGGSSNIVRHLKEGEQVILMGPTGQPSEIPQDETVMLVGGGLGNAVLFSIGKAMKERGCRVLYFAGYRRVADRYKISEIEKASDITIWCCEEGLLGYNREVDKAFKGNVVQAIEAYGHGEMGDNAIKLQAVDRILVIGSDRMMAAVSYARYHSLKGLFKNSHIAIGSINSPMQCMMKEICAQCMQRHIDPNTKKDYYVFSCFNQDQLLDEVDFSHLRSRLTQNSLQEKICTTLINQLSKDAA